MYFRNVHNGKLEIIYDDATTCTLLSLLNERRKADIYVVQDNSTERASGSRSLLDSMKDHWDFTDFLNEVDKGGEVGEVGLSELNDISFQLDEELNGGEEEFIDVNEEYLSDGDDVELQEARSNLKNLDKGKII